MKGRDVAGEESAIAKLAQARAVFVGARLSARETRALLKLIKSAEDSTIVPARDSEGRPAWTVGRILNAPVDDALPFIFLFAFAALGVASVLLPGT